ncbi:MAG: DUF1800 domain-containing protein [Gemmatimonadaceae bacterium]|nr:DUF1800 domain-containing protein [Gemmatimonadaceae bacterium]
MTTASSSPATDADTAIEHADSPTARTADETAPATSTRRRAVIAGLAAAAATLIPSRARAQGIKRPLPRSPKPTPRIPDEVPVAPVEWASDSIRLLRRITYAVTDADVAAARKYGYRGYLERQLDYKNIDDSAVNAFVAARYPLLSQTTEQLYVAETYTARYQLAESTLYRAAFSNRQLYERMVEFWSDHFNISIAKVQYLKLVDDRDVIRKHALGNFRDLLYASAKSGAMMQYLDQNQSRSGAPNQNYAREIMELHTLGVDGGYTQNDVAELSRVLTGWTIAGRGDFYFNPALHDRGAKTLLGVTVPAITTATAASIKEGEQIIDLLLAHPSTARFLSTKMLRWLLSYEPTAAQVTAVADVYTRTGGDIKEMVRTSLTSSWLRDAPMKFKRPFHFLASSLRVMYPAVTSLAGQNAQLVAVGQPLFMYETPDGYPDKVEYWGGNIMPRWNYASTITALAAGEVIPDIAGFMRGNSADSTIAAIDTRIFGSEMDPALRASLTTYLKAAAYSAARVRETLALALSANSFQWY